MAIDLDGAVALVTGGANGICAAAARRLAVAASAAGPTLGKCRCCPQGGCPM